MVLAKLPVAGRPTYLDGSMARAYCACSRCGCFFFLLILDIFCHSSFSLVYHFSLLSPSVWETVRHRLKYFSKDRLAQNNQPTQSEI